MLQSKQLFFASETISEKMPSAFYGGFLLPGYYLIIFQNIANCRKLLNELDFGLLKRL